MSNKNLSIFKDFGVIAFLVLFPHLVPLPFYSYAAVCFLLIFIILRREGKNLSSIGLIKEGITLKSVLIGILSAIVWVGFMKWIYIPTIQALFLVPDYIEYNFIKGNISSLFFIIIAAWVIGGFYEELVFRGYINLVLEKYFTKLKSSFMWSAMLSSLFFGMYHWQQGIFGIVASLLGGLFWSFLYFRFNRNLWISIISHSIFDTITLTLVYFGIFGK